VAGTKGDSVEVAVIHRPRYDDWSIPKGKLNVGEIEVEGAVREVLEETGYRPTIVCPLGESAYLKEGRPKLVRYWSMRAEGGIFTPSREVDELRWLSVGDARELVTTQRDKDVLERFAALPSELRTVLLVRHATAGSRSDWSGADADRPLDDLGELQAEEFIRLLTRWDVREIHAAPIRRCRATVEPLAAAVGLSIGDQPLLGEQDFPVHRKKAIDWIRRAGHQDTATVLCSQGGVIPDVLTTLAARDKLDLPAPRACKKGSLWSLTFGGDRLHAAEYFPPLA
jgi:8-oxo-dGTP diphosphatase